MFVILDGGVCRHKILLDGGRQALALMMPGRACAVHVGVLAGIDHGNQTITPASVVTIDRAVLNAMVDAHRATAKAMYMAQLVEEGTTRV